MRKLMWRKLPYPKEIPAIQCPQSDSIAQKNSALKLAHDSNGETHEVIQFTIKNSVYCHL